MKEETDKRVNDFFLSLKMYWKYNDGEKINFFRSAYHFFESS
jgi:hypothetical protein